MKNFTNFFVSLFYIGYIKPASGTFASIFSIIILFPLFKFTIIPLEILLILFIIIILLSIYSIKIFSLNTKTHDSSIIVIDEFIGLYLIFIFYEKLFIFNDFLTLLFIFIFFRFYDIFKIFPANLIDKKLINSFGVILDDIVAATYTIITIYLINVYLY